MSGTGSKLVVHRIEAEKTAKHVGVASDAKASSGWTASYVVLFPHPVD